MNGLRQGGMSIVELMIALTIGLVVIMLCGSLFITASAGFATQREQAAVEDAGRFALAAIDSAARQAGHVDWENGQHGGQGGAAPAFINGLDAASLNRNAVGMSNPRDPVANGSDVLALRFSGSGAAPDGDGAILDCAGFSIHAGRQGWSIFYVGLSSAGEPELRCKYRGDDNWSADAIVAGVDSFQVLYGLDTDTPADGMPNEYVSASALHTLDAGLVLVGASDAARERDRNRKTHWKRVASIKLGLVLHGMRPTRNGGKDAVFELFGPGYSDSAGSADRGARLSEAEMAPALRNRDRRAFSSTVLLRNPSD